MRHAWLVVLGTTSAAAWAAITLGGSDLGLAAFCSTGTPWTMPLSVRFDLGILFIGPAKLAFGWTLMVAAMMPPLIAAPLRHVYDRSFASRRTRSMLLFVVGYATVWITAGVGLQAIALATRSAIPVPLVWFSLATAMAMLWQVSPAKQWCLNRCHRRANLAAFGAAADRDAFDFGLLNGASCVGACWALMLLPLLAGHGHVMAMIVVTLFVFAERLERPAPLEWRWRGPGKALRIAAAQIRSFQSEIVVTRRVGRDGQAAAKPR